MNDESTDLDPSKSPEDAIEEATAEKPASFMGVIESVTPGKPGNKDQYRGNTADPISRPYITVERILQSNHAQTIFKRQFDFLDNKFYQLSIVLRILTNEAGAVALERIVEAEMEKLRDEMANQLLQTKKLLDDHGLAGSVIQFSAPKKVIANISSPRSKAFLDVLTNLDELLSGISMLWFLELITAQQFNSGSYNWRRRVTTTMNRIAQVCSRALSAARKMVAEKGGNVAVSMARDRGEHAQINAAVLSFLHESAPADEAVVVKAEADREASSKQEAAHEAAFASKIDDAFSGILTPSQ